MDGLGPVCGQFGAGLREVSGRFRAGLGPVCGRFGDRVWAGLGLVWVVWAGLRAV